MKKMSVQACSESIWARQDSEGMPDSKCTLYNATEKTAAKISPSDALLTSCKAHCTHFHTHKTLIHAGCVVPKDISLC